MLQPILVTGAAGGSQGATGRRVACIGLYGLLSYEVARRTASSASVWPSERKGAN